MTITDNTKEFQHAKVFGKQPEIILESPCRIGDGIIYHQENEKQFFIQKFKNASTHIHMFIPASGSGSRMFQFLFDFLEVPDDENRGKVERFLNHLDDFAFSRKIAPIIKSQLEHHQIDLEQFVNYVVSESGLNFGQIPKGLIPFHKYGYFILNPFQEQVLQAALLNDGICKVHFTINPQFKEIIETSLEQIKEISGFEFSIEFSSQNLDSNSMAFTEDGIPLLLDNGIPLSRPSGHGALLPNLNEIDADIIFIKNIDNIQHQVQTIQPIEEIQYISGVLMQFNEELKALFANKKVDKEALRSFLTKYELAKNTDAILALSDEELHKWMNKPRRVCGMVKNEGQPGGGPFWVKKNEKITKQIIEKTQINLSSQQYNLMIKSSHFNPVMMACDIKGLNGEKLNLEDYCDNESYFIVKKRYKGKTVQFVEQPGLWNGSMADWHTVFVEIPSTAFSPVKIVLDLLEDTHREL